MSNKLVEIAIEILRQTNAEFLIVHSDITYSHTEDNEIKLDLDDVKVEEKAKPIIFGAGNTRKRKRSPVKNPKDKEIEDLMKPKAKTNRGTLSEPVFKQNKFKWSQFKFHHKLKDLKVGDSVLVLLADTNPEAPLRLLQSRLCNVGIDLYGNTSFRTTRLKDKTGVKFIRIAE